MAKETKVKALEEIVHNLVIQVDNNTNQLESLANNKSTGLFRGKRARVAIVDTKTHKVYISKSAAGKALAKEADTTPEDHFAWYKLIAKFPDRFVEASPEEKAKAEKEQEARVAKEIEEANANSVKEEEARVAKEIEEANANSVKEEEAQVAKEIEEANAKSVKWKKAVKKK